MLRCSHPGHKRGLLALLLGPPPGGRSLRRHLHREQPGGGGSTVHRLLAQLITQRDKQPSESNPRAKIFWTEGGSWKTWGEDTHAHAGRTHNLHTGCRPTFKSRTSRVVLSVCDYQDTQSLKLSFISNVVH